MFGMLGGGGVQTSTLHFANEISFETVAKLTMELDEVPSNKVSIHFVSGGGSYAAMKSLVHTINNHEKEIDIVLVGLAASAGFLFLCECTRPIYVTKGALGMIHYGDIELSARELKDKKSFSSFMLKDIESLNSEMLEHAMDLGVSDEDLEFIDGGGDYWVSHDTMHKWFHTAEEPNSELTPEEQKAQLIEDIAIAVTEMVGEMMGVEDELIKEAVGKIAKTEEVEEDSELVDHTNTVYEDSHIKIISKEEDSEEGMGTETEEE